MTLDSIQYALMLMIFPVAVWTITSAMLVSRGAKLRIALILALWFGFTCLATVPSIGPAPGALFGIIFPVLAMSHFMFFSQTARGALHQTCASFFKRISEIRSPANT